MISQTKSWQRKVLGGLGALVLAGGVVWGLSDTSMVAFAQSTSDSPQTAQNQPATENQGWFGRAGNRGPMGRGGMMGGFAQGGALLANALGITEAELQSAHEAVAAKAIEQAVTDGLLTQAQADQLQARGGMMGGIGRIFDREEADAALAEALGITVEDLAGARDTMFDKGVEAGLLTQAQANEMKLHALIRETQQQAREEALAQAVEEGLLTQAQADNMLKNGPGMGAGPMGRAHGFGDDHRGPGRNRGPRFQWRGGPDTNKDDADQEGTSDSNFLIPGAETGSGGNL